MTKVDKVGSNVPDLLCYDNCFEGVCTHENPCLVCWAHIIAVFCVRIVVIEI